MLAKILILDRDTQLCGRLTSFLLKNGYFAEAANSIKDALDKLKSNAYDFLFSNCFLQNPSDVETLHTVTSLCPDIRVIYISDHENIQLAVELMKNGAYHYMLKPIFPEKLLELISTGVADKKKGLSRNDETDNTQKENTALSQTDEQYVWGQSSVARKMYSEILLVAPTNYNVIIQGETGTGKESVARMIHRNSKRNGKPFVAVDCGSLSRELAASELFGHEKGAFTGASMPKQGAFELADGGILFLDEIGNLAYEVQLYLLRSIQEGMIRRVGSVAEKKVDVRIIVATNEDLFSSVRRKKFREDLFHRLNEFSIYVPALRERKDDLELLLNAFVSATAERLGKRIKGFAQDTFSLLEKYHWPGNIRELKNMVKRACLLTKSECISESSLPPEILQPELSFPDADMPDEQPEELHATEQIEPDSHLKNIALKAEYFTIMNVLKKVKFNKSKAAEILKIDRKTLYNKLKRNINT